MIQFDLNKPLHIIPVGRVAIDFNPTDYNRPLNESSNFNKYLGGSPANIAVGMARLGNRVGFLAELRLEDGTALYTSPLLEPGQAVMLVPLEKTLAAGVYKAMVVYSCVTLDEKHTPLNGAVSGFTLYVVAADAPES